jgi:hypothetical protein
VPRGVTEAVWEVEAVRVMAGVKLAGAPVAEGRREAEAEVEGQEEVEGDCVNAAGVSEAASRGEGEAGPEGVGMEEAQEVGVLLGTAEAVAALLEEFSAVPEGDPLLLCDTLSAADTVPPCPAPEVRVGLRVSVGGAVGSKPLLELGEMLGVRLELPVPPAPREAVGVGEPGGLGVREALLQAEALCAAEVVAGAEMLGVAVAGTVRVAAVGGEGEAEGERGAVAVAAALPLPRRAPDTLLVTLPLRLCAGETEGSRGEDEMETLGEGVAVGTKEGEGRGEGVRVGEADADPEMLGDALGETSPECVSRGVSEGSAAVGVAPLLPLGVSVPDSVVVAQGVGESVGFPPVLLLCAVPVSTGDSVCELHMVGERVGDNDSVPVTVCEAEPRRGEKVCRGEAVVLADVEKVGALGVGLPGMPAV